MKYMALTTAFLFVLCGCAGPRNSTASRVDIRLRADAFPINFYHYFPLKECDDTLRKMEKEFPDFVSVGVMGKSLKGKEILVATLTNTKTGKPEDKPAMYMDGNIHGNEVQGAEVCLFTMWYLIYNYGRVDFVTDLLDNNTFYVAPVVNPDARVSFFENPNNAHTPRRNFQPNDDDGDGAADEDDTDDIDGDGEIRQMRRKNPFGRNVRGETPDLTRHRRWDESGEYEMLGEEGLDNDNDGLVNEDPIGGVDLNRNFPSAWQVGNGAYPCSEPEVACIVKFILARPNIAAIQDYHNNGNMILRPPARPNANLEYGDAAYYEALRDVGKLYLPDYRWMQTNTELYGAPGSFVDWGYMELGVFCFTNELWDITKDYDGNGTVSREEEIRWIKEVSHGKEWKDWTPFKHPLYGDIETGGAGRWITRTPPESELEDLCRRNCLFSLEHAKAMPRLGINDISVENLGDDLYRVTVRVANNRLFPTASARAQKLGIEEPVLLTLDSGGALEILSGGTKEEFKSDVDLQKNPQSIEWKSIPGRSEVLAEWIVLKKKAGKISATAKVTCVKASSAEKTVEIGD